MKNSIDSKTTEETFQELLHFERLLSNLSAQFVHLSADQVDSAIQQALQTILEFFQVDRCAMVRITPEKKEWQITHAALAENDPPIPLGIDLSVSSFPWAYDKLIRERQAVIISNLEDLPPEAAADKQSYSKWGIVSSLNLPIAVGGPVTHVISINSVNRIRIWPQELVSRLRLLGEVFVNALSRSAMEQALLESEARLLLASSAAEAGLWMVNTETGFIWATQTTRELLGLSPSEELTFAHFLEVVHPDDRSMVQKMTVKALDLTQVDSIEYRVLRPDGSCRWITSRGQASSCPLRQPGSLMGVSIDITKRKNLEIRVMEQLVEINRLKRRLEDENRYLRDEVRAERGGGTIVGSSDVLKYVLFRAKQVAPTDATVLILGETGTGKGLVASTIHEKSNRRKQPLITVNCAALPANLIESELFGREKGAFTGAHTRQAGRFELADGGTLFLDEIGEMPFSLQVKLLRVLQDGEFERLGGTRTIKVDVRVIAATSRDLKSDVAAGRFREDLYYRLHVFPLTLPPLRTRADDIPQLTEFFIERYSKKFSKHFSAIAKETMAMLVAYHWPGNVRELEHIVERSVITSTEPEFRLADSLEGESQSAADTPSLIGFDAMAREHVLHVLEHTNWKIEGKGGAAEALGLHPSTLRFRIKKLGIKRF